MMPSALCKPHLTLTVQTQPGWVCEVHGPHLHESVLLWHVEDSSTQTMCHRDSTLLCAKQRARAKAKKETEPGTESKKNSFIMMAPNRSCGRSHPMDSDKESLSHRQGLVQMGGQQLCAHDTQS